MLKIAVCDDQEIHCKIAAQFISQYAKKRGFQMHITVFTSGKALLRSNKPYDIIFLDIEMGNENGMTIGKEYAKKRNARIILLTSHEEEMQNGYKIRAFRFLVKPIIEDELFEALDSAIDEIHSIQKIQVHDGAEILILNVCDVIYFEAGDRNVGVRTENGFYEIHDVLKNVIKQLNPLEFYMPHRTYIVNMNYVAEVKDMSLILTNGEKIKISRLRKQDFKNTFYEYIHRKVRDE